MNTIHSDPAADLASIRDALDFELPSMDDMQDAVRMKFLYESALAYADPRLGSVLEIGCFKGCSTVFLAMACRDKGFEEITTIDLFTGTPSWGQTFDTLEEATRRFEDYGLGSFIRTVRTDSQAFSWQGPLAMLHVDGDHSYEAVKKDFARYLPHLAPGGIIVADDYDSGHEGVIQAVHELLASNPDLTIVGINNHRQYYGSICLRRNSSVW
ncbi:MAG: class I SAM-dependent methyltransferase [Planctomycetota bacterium]